MVGALTLERVRRDVEVVSRAGLDTATFVAEVDASLQRAVPHVGTCVGTLDPATSLLTGTFKFGDIVANHDRDHQWALVEYGDAEPGCFAELARSDRSAYGVHHATGGDVHRSLRLRDFLEPHYGYADELRMVARHAGRTWGGMALFRGPTDEPFDAAEIAYLESLSELFAAGLRSGLLVRLGEASASPSIGPAVVIVGSDDELSQVSMGAEGLLQDLAGAPNMAPATGLVGALVAGARRYAAGAAEALPRARVRLRSGRWLLLHASPLSGASGASGDVVVTLEEARPPEIVPLIVAAFELTARERDVAQLVLQGMDTKEIATALHMSRYTVQDHLKSVFDKADVRSRRELVSRIFFDQYSPRLGTELGPAGWFSDTAPPVASRP